MRILHLFLVTCGFLYSSTIAAQAVLPDFTVVNSYGKVAVCWQHKYSTEIKGISIQRSYDSLKHFSSIASVSFPRDIANGYICLPLRSALFLTTALIWPGQYKK